MALTNTSDFAHDIGFPTVLYSILTQNFDVILRLHYVPGGHGGHVSDNRDQNGITVRQRRGAG